MINNYWQNKIAAYLQESVIKIFDIKNRDKYANLIKEEIAKITNLDFSCADDKRIKQASYIASGLTRAALPSDDSKLTKVTIKHPLVQNTSLGFDISKIQIEELLQEVIKLLNEDLSKFSQITDKEQIAKQVFNYLFFAFNKNLRKNNIGNLGSFWDIIPSDTRMPDHPMWHHFGMTSSIYSCLENNQNNEKENLSIVVYSITPVQEFISKARKLRDYWTGSVILSYLAFCGITQVAQILGPDHILYPSLQNQALVEQWLIKQNSNFKNYLAEKDAILKKLNDKSQSIASFPNKFVFLCHNGEIEKVCKSIEEKINKEWIETCDIVKDYIAKKTNSENSIEFNTIWDNGISNYWKYSWAATNFATINNQNELEELLSKDKWQKEFETMKKFDSCFADKNKLFPNYDATNLYGTTHSFVQALLAAGKTKPTSFRSSQIGEKCPLCGELSVLNNTKGDNKIFWNTLREKVNPNDETLTIGKNERLCAVCTVKRFLPLKNVFNDESHILYKTLVESYKDNFPSTTEMSCYEFLKSDKVDENKKNEIIKKIHENEFETDDERLNRILENSKEFETKYYAFLLMDGDKMGDLINGETTEATWNDVINLSKEKIASSPFNDKTFAEQKRTMNPALHSMISDSLNNFARYGVMPLVEKSGGKLIYAGGDDVCAILPLSKAFKTADEIRKVYQLSYGQVTDEGSKKLNEAYSSMAKIVTHLGQSQNQDKTKISLSGAIIIAHHKQPLKEVIQIAHQVLDGVAKEKSGRNSLAIRLSKRSGGDRDVWFNWEEKNLFANEEKTVRESFLDVIRLVGKKLSSSLLYKVENLKQSFEPLVDDIELNKDLIIKLFEYEIAHSIYSQKKDLAKANELAKDIAGLCIKCKKSSNGKITKCENWYNPESLIVANFLATTNFQEAGGKN